MKTFSPTTAQRALEKLRAVCWIETEVPIALRICFSERGRKRARKELSRETSIHNQARAAIALLIFPTSQRLCSNPAIAAFAQEPAASNLFGCGISAPAAPRRLTPVSSAKPSRRAVSSSLLHENETLKICLQPPCPILKTVPGMNRKSNCGPGFLPPKVTLLTKRGGRSLKFSHQVPSRCGQGFGNFYKRIHRRRFFAAFYAANKNRRKIGFLGESFLREIGIFASGTNGFPQQTTMWLAGRHDGLKDEKSKKIAIAFNHGSLSNTKLADCEMD